MKQKEERNTLEMVSAEGLVPQNHLLRKIDSAVDFPHIYDFMQDLLRLTSVSAVICWSCYLHFRKPFHFPVWVYIGKMLVTYAAPFSGW